MTSFEPSIQRVRVEAFRGFRDSREFDLSASAVIITGPNGTGKTSFFDALQWCFVGSIERLENLRARRSVEHIVNQYRLGRKAVVEVELLIDSKAITLRRSGDHKGSTLELRSPGSEAIFGLDAEVLLRRLLLPETDLSIGSALKTSGLMQQDVMRGVLEAKGADRYHHLSTVLGLGQLEEFEEAARSIARLAAEREATVRGERDRIALSLNQTREKLAAARSRLESRPQVEAIRQEIQSLLSSPPLSITGPPSNLSLEAPDEIRELATRFATAIDMIQRLRAVSRRAQELQSSLEQEPTEADVTAIQAEVDRAENEVASVGAQVVDTNGRLAAGRSAANELAQLAAFAIPLLTHDCPVCGQPIDPAHVEAELRRRAESTDTIVALQEELVSQQATHLKARDLAAASHAALSATKARIAQWEEFRLAATEAQSILQRLQTGDFVVHPAATAFDQFAQTSDEVLNYLQSSRRRLLEFLNTVDQQADSGAVERSVAEAKNLELTLATSEALLEEESARSQRLHSLAEHSVTARVEVTERRVRAMQPLVANIFQRLDPHPAFKTIEFELDTYYRRGTTSPLVRDVVEGVSADPLLVFSTSQANIVALSYFIAMSLSTGRRGLPFLLLDDPVQSMDDVNVLGFADLCRHLQSRRQLIVSTHERRFAGLLERKLAPRTTDAATKLIRFVGWDRSGPTIDEIWVEPQLLEDPIRVVRQAG
ncbi:AAA family ATPase [Mycolicibacterium sp. 624]|uniref:AAA family ATPase n=1 Tax=Mycolicibacterium sp. 624 TaxID=3156314 RepID=UPI00339578D5